MWGLFQDACCRCGAIGVMGDYDVDARLHVGEFDALQIVDAHICHLFLYAHIVDACDDGSGGEVERIDCVVTGCCSVGVFVGVCFSASLNCAWVGNRRVSRVNITSSFDDSSELIHLSVFSSGFSLIYLKSQLNAPASPDSLPALIAGL